MKKRCEWAGSKNPLMLSYHDKEWGKPVKKDLQHLDAMDQQEQETEVEPDSYRVEQRIHIANQLDNLHQRKVKYEQLKKEVELAREKGESQISTFDRDARALPKKMNIVEVSYNVLTAVKAKNKLITNFHISNKSDTYALSGLSITARKVLEKSREKH